MKNDIVPMKLNFQLKFFSFNLIFIHNTIFSTKYVFLLSAVIFIEYVSVKNQTLLFKYLNNCVFVLDV